MITVQAIVRCTLEETWKFWTGPEHIVHWNHASDDWHTPSAQNDVTVNGRFRFTMAAKDGSAAFDFEGTYTAVEPHALIEYVIDDGRKVSVTFERHASGTNVVEVFDAETVNAEELQRSGWQSILDNFKAYAERTSQAGE